MKKIIFAMLFSIAAASVPAQMTVRGLVLDDSTRQPVPFVLIHLEGTYQSVYSDEYGEFVLNNVRGEHRLHAQMLGYDEYVSPLGAGDSNLTIYLHASEHVQDEVIVSATRVEENSAMAHSDLNKEQIEATNNGQDFPYILNSLPSVVTTSDAGAGVGYTGLRVRGSDATRVNVTINGVPVNDAESQGTYWVDIPDLASSTESIQLQRGAGTSTNGAGAFGGSLNIQTDGGIKPAYGEIILSGGSFNTQRITAKAGTGLLNDHFVFETRMSRLTSDGYIDRANSDLTSWYGSGSYYGKKLTIRAIAFSGKERTYQAWYGVPQDSLKTNRTFNMAGMYFDTTFVSAGPSIDTTIQTKYYDNETDNYRQDYYQLHFIVHPCTNWTVNWTFHATKGKGYYEEFWQGDDLFNYGLDTASHSSDITRRLWLDNWFYGLTFATQYSKAKTGLTIGGGWNNYKGYHYNEVISGTSLPSGFITPYRYSNEYAHKSDGNIYAKLDQHLSDALLLFVDLQDRMINYSFVGVDTTGGILPQDVSMNFFNPKAGLNYAMKNNMMIYGSFSIANKEPNRDDFVNTTINSRPKPETLYDAEFGWKYHSQKFGSTVNFYYMNYKDQLVLTGKVNDVGAYTRQNVDKSYRRGVELIAGYQVCEQLNFSANATLSQNKIVNFHEFIDDYDNGVQIDSLHSLTDIAFSPSIIGAAELAWSRHEYEIVLQEKYVGKQFLDNTSNDTRMLEAYMNTNLRLSYTAILKGTKLHCMEELKFSLFVNNLTNAMYSSNGYTYGWIAGGTYNLYNYYYPQAGINFLGMVSMKFGG